MHISFSNILRTNFFFYYTTAPNCPAVIQWFLLCGNAALIIGRTIIPQIGAQSNPSQALLFFGSAADYIQIAVSAPDLIDKFLWNIVIF